MGGLTESLMDRYAGDWISSPTADRQITIPSLMVEVVYNPPCFGSR
jgi:hypothetical protein